MPARRSTAVGRKVRYAVVGLGHIAQAAALPAFAHSRKNSELVALVSGDPAKRRVLSRKFRVHSVYSYEQYEECLAGGGVDAVYLATPNSMHRDFTTLAARYGVHVLCEKPMAVTTSECEQMIRACNESRVKLMIAYRLHFDRANLTAAEIVNSGRLGDARIFTSVFALQVRPGNIRVKKDLGGGTLYDIGIYCINAARYLFRAEPTEVLAASANGGDRRFKEIDEMTSAILRFPGERLALFTSSFGAFDTAVYQVTGTKGTLRLEQAYEYAEPMTLLTEIDGHSEKKRFGKRDQFAPELLYFSDCILHNRQPEPSGLEGLADVRVIEALSRSAATGKAVKLGKLLKGRRPTLEQEIRRPPVRKPEVFRAAPASQD